LIVREAKSRTRRGIPQHVHCPADGFQVGLSQNAMNVGLT
jgi:hypothetical protein